VIITLNHDPRREKAVDRINRLIHLFGDVFGSSGFVEGDDDEAAAAAHLDDDGQELGVDGAEVGVVSVASDFHLRSILTFIFGKKVAKILFVLTQTRCYDFVDIYGKNVA
jgi:hypothetical protein